MFMSPIWPGRDVGLTKGPGPAGETQPCLSKWPRAGRVTEPPVSETSLERAAVKRTLPLSYTATDKNLRNEFHRVLTFNSGMDDSCKGVEAFNWFSAVFKWLSQKVYCRIL